MPRSDEPTHADHLEWAAAFETELERLALTGQEFTSDHVRAAVVRQLGPAPRPHVMGGIFKSARDRGEIIETSIRRSVFASRHGGLHRAWIGSPPEDEQAAA